jgi:DNA mismatch repair ATPase MutS
VKHDWLESIFIYKDGCIQEKYAPEIEFRTLRSQIRFFRNQLNGFLLFIRMGTYVELYDKDAETMHEIAGGQLKKGFRGMKTALGFPINMRKTYIQKALEKGYSAALLEEGKPGKWIRHRYVVTIYNNASKL